MLVRAPELADPRVVRLCEAAQGTALREAMRDVPGYDLAGAGTIHFDVA